MDEQRRRDLRNIILVLSGSVLSAVALCAYMIHSYGPSGRYMVSNALLNPEVAQKLDYVDSFSAKGRPIRFILDGFVFSYYDQTTRKQEKKALDPAKYAKFYELVSGDRSVEEVTNEIMTEFEGQLVATLSINVRPEGSQAVENTAKVFQTVQFSSKGDHFRVQLHQQGGVGDWVYFYHPGIYADMMKAMN